MAVLIVAFPKLEEAKALKNLLVKNGYQAEACTSGTRAVTRADILSDGLIISGYRLGDGMLFSELNEYKPKSFGLLVITSGVHVEECAAEGVMCLKMPLAASELLDTVEMMLSQQIRRRKKARSTPRQRTPEEQKIIDEAKAALMEHNHMTEPEAFRYIQKCSMDSGNTLVESARMVLTFLG
ncbi:MAG: ANTAR domain-containing response regulator [Lachnospiraceae bacterium]|jgi:response regulator NasT